MGLVYYELNPGTRQLMCEEIEFDLINDRLFISNRLTEQGITAYPNLLIEAAKNYDDDWLAGQLREKKLLKDFENRKTKSGLISARVPENANVTLAEGEFNRFYCRAVCVDAIKKGVKKVLVYRGKAVSSPRYESESKIGVLVDPSELLFDLRSSVGVETALGIPSGPNSGLTIRLP